MGYLIFRGVNTNNLLDTIDGASVADVYVSKMPSHKKAAMRNTEYYVKGRDGALHVDEGFENYDMEVQLVLVNATANMRYIVNAWADGTGKLISSDDTSKAYMASVKEEIEWTRVKSFTGFFDTAKIIFNCQPCMYEAVDSVIEYTASTSIINPGSAVAYPLIKVEGSGDATFEVGGEEILIADMAANVPVYIDCENGYVYTDSGAATMTGEIPVLPMGTSQIVLGNNVNKLTITPHWRWV